MIGENLQKDISERIQKYPSLQNGAVFLFGSSIRDPHFHDVDIGVLDADEKDLSALTEEFEESTFPYKVDIVNFSHVSGEFKDKVFSDGVVWLTPQKK